MRTETIYKKIQKTMASKIIKIKVSKASKLQIQTLKLELGLMAKQWLRKVKVVMHIDDKGNTKKYKYNEH